MSHLLIVGGEKVFLPTNECWAGGLNRNSTMGLKHGPKAIGEVFEEFALFLYLGPRMGLTRVVRWPKNTSYNRHVSKIGRAHV